MDKINLDRNVLWESIKTLRTQKDLLRESFYKQLLAFEIQQLEIGHVEFLTKIKERVLEKEAQRLQWEAEKQARLEERQKKIEEAQKREEARRQREEELWKEEEEKQRKWEEGQLQRLDVHPFTYEIELCEFLFRYCQKQDVQLNGRLVENKLATNIQSRVAAQKAAMEQERREMEEKRKKAIEEAVQKGKLMRAEVVKEKAPK
jgi:hypothetical protein